jgi:Homeodomain-like domain
MEIRRIWSGRSGRGGSVARAVERARIVLLAADGLPGKEIGRLLGCSEPGAVLWRNRYAERVVMLGCSLRCLTSSRMSGVSRWWSMLTAKLTANRSN